MKLLPDWTETLTLQQQAVLLLALRGPDGFPKYHACKGLLYFYRACVLKAAHKGRMLQLGEHCGSLMTMRYFDDDWQWNDTLNRFAGTEDELPLHFYTHLMHGAQVLAYKHPSALVRKRWFQFYEQCCNYLHVPVESERTMDGRLNDFGRPHEEVIDGN